MQILRKSFLYSHVMAKSDKIVALTANTEEIVTLLYNTHFMAKLDKNHFSKCKYWGNITTYGPLCTVLAYMI